MYNRYIRNDNGSYTRIPEEESPQTASVGPSPGRPEPSKPPPGAAGGPQASAAGPPPGGADSQKPPPNMDDGPQASTAGPPPGGPEQKGPRPGNGSQGPSGRVSDGLTGFLQHILNQLHLDHVDTGDLLLLVLLFFLFRENADEELLVALGLLLIL